jgi:hypothetical protein
MCTARGAPCRKDEANFCRSDAELDVRCITGVAKKFSRFELDARLRRSVSYRLIIHIFARLVLPPPLICDCRRSWFVFVVWVAVEQSMVRSRTMTRIGITSSIHTGATQEQCNHETVHGTTLQVLAVGPAKGKRRKVKEVHVFYPDSALGALSRLCCRLPLFEVLGSRSLMIWPNGVPASPSPLKNPSSLLLKVSYALLVA